MALKRLPNTHSIIELVANMVAWRNFVISRLGGNNDFTVTNELNFPSPSDWEIVLNTLDQSQHELFTAIQQFPEGRLRDLVPHAEHKYTFYTLLHGIIHHDLYHIGQIALVKKSLC
jgi:hypothetical protein